MVTHGNGVRPDRKRSEKKIMIQNHENPWQQPCLAPLVNQPSSDPNAIAAEKDVEGTKDIHAEENPLPQTLFVYPEGDYQWRLLL